MTILNQKDSMLLIIDVQDRLINAAFNYDVVLKNSEILAKAAAILDLPVFITEQYPKGLGSTIEQIKGIPGLVDAKYYEKDFFNALLDLDLLDAMKKTGRKQVIIYGIEAHICVYQTVLGLLENGFEASVVANACGARFADSFTAGIEAMKSNGAYIKNTEMVLFELLKGAKHPKFKEIQALIK